MRQPPQATDPPENVQEDKQVPYPPSGSARRHGAFSLRSFQAIGYKEIIDGLDKGEDIETIKELIKKNSRNYAKRQYTYFNHQLEVNWFDSLKDAEEFGVRLFKKE